MTTCDRCFDPGSCCRDLFLSTADTKEPTFWIADGIGAVIDWLRANGLPFRPLRIHKAYHDRKTDLGYASWRFSCPCLEQATGRCSIYDRRPKLCRDYEPGQDGLCVHHNGAETGEGLAL